jgi:hypothetical protein
MRTEQHYYLGGKLHTEVLEERYGKISLQVLHDDDQVREVLLTDQKDIARTYAITIRSNDWRNDEDICAINETIRAGEPIGKAFKSRGYAIRKNVMAVYPLALPEWLQHAFMVEASFGKTRITEFIVEKNGLSCRYGYVTEVYSPDFRKPLITVQDVAQIRLTASQRSKVAELKKQVNEMLAQIAPVLLFF